MRKLVHTEDVAKRRRAEYPPLEDLADALYWRDRGDPRKWEAYCAKVEAIKTKFQKGVA